MLPINASRLSAISVSQNSAERRSGACGTVGRGEAIGETGASKGICGSRRLEQGWWNGDLHPLPRIYVISITVF